MCRFNFDVNHIEYCNVIGSHYVFVESVAFICVTLWKHTLLTIPFEVKQA